MTERTKRIVIITEFAFGAFMVLGHNVWRIVPNEVLALTALAILSMRLHAGRWDWSALGFRRPESWRRILLLALAAAVLRLLVGSFVVEPLAETLWGTSKLPEGANEIAGNLANALLALALVWTFAAFGEEITYRGFLLERGAHALGGAPPAYWIAAVASAVLFGYGHYYKGMTGVLDSGVAGLILATAYLMSGRNIWTCVLAHGFIDTFGVTWLFLGLPGD